MTSANSPRLRSFFRAVVARRWWIAAIFAVLSALGVWLSSQIETDHSIARLIVAGDPDVTSNDAFQKIFPEGEQAILLAEAKDPFAPDVLKKVEDLERRLGALPRVGVFSALDLYERARSLGGGAAAGEDGFRRFATGTDLFRRQGLVGPDFLGIALELKVANSMERDETLAAVDQTLSTFEASPGPIERIRRVGGPFVDAYLESETGRASLRYFPLFGLFIVTIILGLYRSGRTLAAFLLTLAASVSIGVGAGKLLGFSFTIVSSLVPLTLLITCTAALVYIQSRFAEDPGEGSVEEHQIFTLANKFVPSTASIVAAAIGFAALAVSGIRPIRELGLWVAGGLILTWITAFTLFPALQRILSTPIRRRPTSAGRRMRVVLDALPVFTFRWRWVLLPASALVMVAGLVAFTGIPGRLEPMKLETDSLAYIDQSLPLYKDTRRFEKAISGLSVLQVWVETPGGGALRPEILRGLELFAREMESTPAVGSVTGPTTLLKWMRYITGQGDHLPDDPSAWPALAAQLEQILFEEPASRGYVDVGTLEHSRLTVVYRGEEFRNVEEIQTFVLEQWRQAVSRESALADCKVHVVGQGLLQARIADNLVPTLTESLALTAAIIFVAFLVVFRSAAARLMAMIPSVFALLVMFLVMRLVDIPLNVATILVASTVLGASENDQIHFFYHFQEKREGHTIEEALRHALRIAGRGIMFATLINAGGFLALALSGLPPMRQFGIITASAFVLSMLASLLGLPATLWIVSRERPDGYKN